MSLATKPVRRSAEGRPEIVDPRSTTVPFVMTALLVLAGFVLAIWALTDSLEGSTVTELPTLEVPRVSDLGIDVARADLERNGFVVEVSFQPNESEPKGTVIGQKPLAGSKVEQGELVTLLASDGPLGLAIPGIEGQQGAEAAAVLQSSGLAIELAPTPSETVRPNEAIGTDPPSGARVPMASSVKLLISSGPAPRIVPTVLTKTVEQALAEIGRSGLAPGKITRAFRADLVPGTVFEVDPPEGTPLPRDTPVSLTVAGPEPTTAVPYLVGLQRSSAEQVLKSAGLNVSVLTTPVAEGDAQIGRIISQGTPPQAKIKEGSTIEVNVAIVVVPVVPPAPPVTAPGTPAPVAPVPPG